METSEKTAWLSILTNLTLVGIKSVLAIASGSLAIKADAIHSLSDVISSIVILVGIRISKRSSQHFPYGLYKVENLVAMGTSFLILLAGYEITREAFFDSSILLPDQIPLSIAGITLTILITWWFSRYELQKGRETGSPSLIADAKHIGTDMLSSIVILASLLGSAAGFAVDRYAAIVVVFFIGRAAFTVFFDAIRVLLDASLDPDSLEKIRHIVVSDSRVVRINELKGRNAGRYKFVELDVCLRVRELDAGHRVAEELKQQVKTSLENVDQVLIHFEAEEKKRIYCAIPLANNQVTISAHFGEAPFFRLVTLQRENSSIVNDTFLKNPFTAEPKAKGMKVANWLLQQGIDIIIVRRDLEGKGPGYVLSNAAVEILVVSETDAEQALEHVRSKQMFSPAMAR